MKNTGGALKERLLSMIGAMGEHPERYAKNPGKDFTRQRSLTLPTLIRLIFTQAAAWEADTAWGCSKYKRCVNFSDAVYLCCQTLRGWFLDVLPLLQYSYGERHGSQPCLLSSQS